MRKNIFTIGLVLVILLAMSALFADLTRPIAEGEVDRAPNSIEFLFEGTDVKATDLTDPNYSRREEIFSMAYRQHYVEAAERFDGENFDIRNIAVTRRSFDRRRNQTTLASTARVVILPEGSFSEAKRLTRPLLNEDKEFVQGAVSGEFNLPDTVLRYGNIPFDVRTWDTAYATLLPQAQAQYGPTADVKGLTIGVKERDERSGQTTYTTTGTVVVK